MSKDSKIKIIDLVTNEILYEYDMSKQDEAYAMATTLEEMGVNITVKTPSVTETLADTLGLSYDQRQEFEQSVVAEIEDHDGSCCATPVEGTDKLQ